MGKIIFVLGGARSGKSDHAISLAKKIGGKVAYIATCQPKDREMKARVALHKKSRPSQWMTFEEPKDIDLLLDKLRADFNAVIIDCLTLLVTNLFLGRKNEKAIMIKMEKILSALKKINAATIIVSNEVGLGIVPQNKLAREFRDICGRVNQLVAKKSDNVLFMVSGLPWRIK